MENKEPLMSRTNLLQENKLDAVPATSTTLVGPANESSNLAASTVDGGAGRQSDQKSCRECLAALAHRLAQPMTALRGGIELGLIGKRSAADYRCVLEQTMQLADNMAQLIVSLRDLGESGASGGCCHSVILEVMAAEILTELEGLAQSGDVRLQLKVQGNPSVSANPERLREALAGLLAWVIQNSSGGVIVVEISSSKGEAQLVLSPSRLDLQYLHIKVLEDIAPPGVLFSHATKNGALGWVINQRLLNGVGGRLEFLTEGVRAGGIRVHFPLAAGD
jgi:hypothetical protein